MRLSMFLVPALFAFAAITPAQTGTVRGEVSMIDDGSFYLRHTAWPLFFTPATIPDHWVGRPLVMDVVFRSGRPDPSMTVQKAIMTDTVFAMGEMAVGSLAKGWVAAKPGAYVTVAFDDPVNLRWQPLGPSVPLATGVWMLGPSAVPVASGFADDVTGRFVFGFDVPHFDQLVGRVVVAQAYFNVGVDGIAFSNLDSKTIRAN